MKKKLDIPGILAAFEEASQKHADALENGDHKTVNRNYDKIVQIVKTLISLDKIDYLSSFLNHTSTGVRLAAAAFLLPTYEKEAVSVLEEIKTGNSFQSLDAEMILEEWHKGNLKL